MNPLRLSYEMFGPRNPFLAWVGDAPSGSVRAVSRSGPAIRWSAHREQLSQQIVDGLEAWRKAVEKLSERPSSRLWRPALQAAPGIDRARASRRARPRRACCTAPWWRRASPSSGAR